MHLRAKLNIAEHSVTVRYQTSGRELRPVAGWPGDIAISSACWGIGSAEHGKEMQEGIDLEVKTWGSSVFGSRKPLKTRVNHFLRYEENI
jgi:hypothetical protein